MKKYLPILVLFCFLLAGISLSRGVAVFSENAPIERPYTIVIDAGHGGVDGGATSCTGILESKFNLEISLRLNDLFHLLGRKTMMIRNEDVSVYTEGTTIAAKKISDLKERVRMIGICENAILVSIHQNHFADARYSGAQTFYAPTEGSKELAQALQSTFVQNINIGSKRQTKRAESVYIMQHIRCPGVLIECGFLSNPEEERQLRTSTYQNKLCICIASTVCQYLDRNEIH